MVEGAAAVASLPWVLETGLSAGRASGVQGFQCTDEGPALLAEGHAFGPGERPGGWEGDSPVWALGMARAAAGEPPPCGSHRLLRPALLLVLRL